MKRMVLVVIAVVGLSVLIVGAGSAIAGENNPQEHWTWQYEEAVGTGALPQSDFSKQAAGTTALPGSGMSSGLPDFDADPRWEASGG